MSASVTLERAVGPLDSLRAQLLRFAFKFRLGAFVAGRRDHRIAFQAAAGVLFTFALTLMAPAAMLALTPVVFGVPHIASDVRYMMIRRSVSRPAVIVSVVCAIAIASLRMVERASPHAIRFGVIELAIALGWFAAMAICGLHRSQKRWKLPLALVSIAALAVVVLPHAETTRILFAHAHNVIAIGVWLFIFRRNFRAAIVPLVFVVAALALLLSGVAVPHGFEHLRTFGYSLDSAAKFLAPGLSPKLGLAIVLSFAFLQSIHYAVWLGWIPQEDLRAEGSLSFKMSLRSMARDFTPRGLALIALASVLVVVAGFFALTQTRELYLTLAVFHGYLELAMVTYLTAASER